LSSSSVVKVEKTLQLRSYQNYVICSYSLTTYWKVYISFRALVSGLFYAMQWKD